MVRRKKIGIRQLKNEASRIVNEVREEEAEYLVTNRGEPVAVLRPVTEAESKVETEEQRRARADRIMETLRKTAREVSRLSSGESAESAVSAQRRDWG